MKFWCFHVLKLNDTFKIPVFLIILKALDYINLLPIASRNQISRKAVNCTLPGLQIKPSRLRLVLNN